MFVSFVLFHFFMRTAEHYDKPLKIPPGFKVHLSLNVAFTIQFSRLQKLARVEM